MAVCTVGACLSGTAAASEELSLFLARNRLSRNGAQPTGGQVIEVGGESVQLVRIPIAFKLLSPEDADWRLRLRLPVSLGFFDLRATLEGERPLKTSIGTVIFQPGVQLIYDVTDEWELKPFVELGAGFQIGDGNDVAFLFSGGLTSLTHFPWRRYVWSIGAQIEYDDGWFEGGNATIDPYTTADLGVEFLFPVSRLSDERRFDASLYLMHRRFLPAAQFEGVDGEILDVDYRHEVGVTFGVEPSFRVWGLKMPRVGFAYRWGERLESWRLNFGFPF